jgi:SAM-dependent methyltransferase
MREVLQYYDTIATRYDESRFGNTYGKFVDAQERYFLTKWLPKAGTVLDAGCGTGRLLDLATCGVDGSSNMLELARKRYPHKRVEKGTLDALPFDTGSFDAIVCMHVFMHLPVETIREILQELYRVVRPGGRLIFDIPSARRRRFTGHVQAGWHGATALSVRDLYGFRDQWNTVAMRGILLTPIHRIPSRFRWMFLPIDTCMGMSPLKEFSSYHLYLLEKR